MFLKNSLHGSMLPGIYPTDFIFLSGNNREDVKSQTLGCSGTLRGGPSVAWSLVEELTFSLMVPSR